MELTYGDWGTLAFVLAGALAGGFVNGLTGFGTGLTALPLWLQAVEPLVAAQLVSAASVVGHVTMLPAIWHAIDWRRLAPMLVAGLVGVPIGTWVLPWISLAAFKSLVGCLLIGYCAFMLFAAGRVRLSAGGRGAEAAIGLAGGVLGGLAGLSGALPTVWATLKGWPKEERRVLFQAFNMTILSAMLVASLVQGQIGLRFLLALGVALPATLAWRVSGIALSIPAWTIAASTASCWRCCCVGAWPRVAKPLSTCHIYGRLLGENGPSRHSGPEKAASQIGEKACSTPACIAALAMLAALAVLVLLPASPPAQETKGAAVPAPETEDGEERARGPQGVRHCAVLHPAQPEASHRRRHLQRAETWRKEVLAKIMERGKITWPWGDARCSGDLKFDRATLIKAMTEPEFEAQFDQHYLRCELEGEKEKYEVKVQIHPKVTFKQGKAVKANLNWGKIEAPLLAKTALWSATAADNTFGVLQGVVVEDINDFIQTKCMEVKEEWQGK